MENNKLTTLLLVTIWCAFQFRPSQTANYECVQAQRHMM